MVGKCGKLGVMRGGKVGEIISDESEKVRVSEGWGRELGKEDC